MSLFWGSAEFYANIHSKDNEDNEELELLVHAYLRDVHYTSRRTAILNVIYSTFNVGLVALPLAAEQSGLPLFIFGICAIALCAGYTTSMIINMAAENGVKTLEDLCEKAFGFRGYVFVCVSQIIFSMSLMCITLDVWADILQSIFTSYDDSIPSKIQHRYFGLLVGFCLLLPISLRAKSLASLRWSSYFSVIAIFAALLCIVAGVACDSDGYKNLNSHDTLMKIVKPKPLGWLLSLVATFCFSNSQKVFTAYYCLRRRSPERWSYVVNKSHIIVAFIYICFGTFGFISNLKSARSTKDIDYFLDFDDISKASVIYFNVLSGVVALSLLLTVPVDCLVAATTIKRLFARYRNVNRLRKCPSNISQFGPIENNSMDRVDARDAIEHLSISHSITSIGSAGTSIATSTNNNGSSGRQQDSESQRQSSLRNDSLSQCTSKEDSNKDPASNLRESLNTIPSVSDTSATTLNSRSRSSAKGSSGNVARSYDAEANKDDDDDDEAQLILGPEEREALLRKKYHHVLEGSDLSTDKRKSDILTALISVVDSDRHTNQSIDGEVIDRYSTTDMNNGQHDTEEDLGEHLRQSSLEELMNKRDTTKFTTDIVPVLSLWLIVLGLCVSYDNFGTLGIVFGPFAAALVVYIIPSMIYFRMGLAADYQASPLWIANGMIPNQLYMLVIQVLGILLLLGNVALVLYFYCSDQVLISF